MKGNPSGRQIWHLFCVWVVWVFRSLRFLWQTPRLDVYCKVDWFGNKCRYLKRKSIIMIKSNFPLSLFPILSLFTSVSSLSCSVDYRYAVNVCARVWCVPINFHTANRTTRAVSLRSERSLSRGFPSLDLDTVLEERSDQEQTQVNHLYTYKHINRLMDYFIE